MTHDGRGRRHAGVHVARAGDGRSRSITARDFYSLGVMLYQMALGRLPFKATTLAALLVAHATEPPPPPSEVAPGGCRRRSRR